MAGWTIRRALLFVTLIGLVASACGATTKRDTETPDLPQPDRNLDLKDEGYLKVYDNGLTLFVVPDSYTRLIQFDVRQQVGSRDDPAGKGGMAHFVEHLMFQMPADGPDSPKVMSDVQQHALSFNAYTSGDETHYMHTGTSEELETYMKYTALRLNYDCDTVPESEFLREREVVRNEHRWRGQGVDAFVYEKVIELVFPDGHPYRRKLLGGDAELVSITPDDACNFIRKYYTPSQASVIVTGDVDPQAVLELANKYLEPLPKLKKAQRKPVPPPTFTQKTAEVKAPVKKPTAVILFSLPKRFTKDYAASQAAIETMFLAVGFFTSKDGSVLEEWYPTGLGGKEAPLFGVAIETKKARDLDRGIDEVLDAITRGFAADVSGDEYKGSYDSARQRARLQVLNQMAIIYARSGAYADYLEEGARPGFYGTELAALDDLTAEQAQKVGRQVFAREKAMVVKVVPDGSKEKPKAQRAGFDYKPEKEEKLAVPEDIDPEEANRPIPLEDIAPPEGQSLEYELESGMRVVLVQSSKIPVMDIQLIVGAGLVDAKSHPDLANLASSAFGVAEGDRDAMILMNYFDNAGGIFFGDVGPLSTTFRSRGLSIYLDFIVAGMSQRIVQADYRTGALEFWKQGRREQLKKESSLQRARRGNALYTAVYGKGHPHVRPQITDKKQLRDISLKDLEQFRAKYYRAANSAVIITGGFDMDLAMKYVEAFFGKPKLRRRKSTWLDTKATADRPPAPEPKPSGVRYITEADKERVQTDILITYPLAEAYGEDHAALMVMASMLNFRVSAVRQKLGASYGVYARLDAGRPSVVVGGSIDSARGPEGLAAIKEAIKGLSGSADFNKEFAFARRSVLRNMLNAQGDPELLAGQLAQAVQNGRSYDYFRDLARKVATLTPAQVKKQIKRVIVDERSVTLVQGPADGIQAVMDSQKVTNPMKLPDVVHDEDE